MKNAFTVVQCTVYNRYCSIMVNFGAVIILSGKTRLCLQKYV